MTDAMPRGATPNTPDTVLPRWRQPAIWRRWGLRLGVAWGLWALFAWQGLPRLLPDLVTRIVADKLHLQARVDAIAINPLAGSVTVDGLGIRDGEELLIGAERIHADLSLASLWRGSVSLDQVDLVKPVVNARIDAEGRLNLMKLVPPKDPEDKPSNLRWAIDHFHLSQGRVSFRDEHRQPVLATELEGSELTLHDLRSYGDRAGGFRFATRLDDHAELTWEGSADLVDLASSGTMTLKQLRLPDWLARLPLKLPVQVTSGDLALTVPYRARVVDNQPSVSLAGAKVQLNNLRVQVAGQTEPLLNLPALEVSGIDLTWPRQTLSIDRVTTRGTHIELLRQADGQLTLLRALARQTQTPPAKSGETAPGKPWQVQLNALDLALARIGLKDASVQPAARLALTDLSLASQGIRYPLEAPIALQLKSRLGQGQLSVEGQVDPVATALDLAVKADALPLPLLQPWISQQLLVQLKSGTASADLQLKGTPGKDLQVRGDLGLQQLEIRHAENGTRLLGLGRLVVRELVADPARHRLGITGIRLDKPFGQVLINADRQLNLASLQRPATTSTPARAEAKAEAKGPAWQVQVGRTDIRDGALLFSDLSMKPGFATGIEHLDGSIGGLDSRPGSSASVKLAGRVAPAGDVLINGRVNPLAKALDLDLALTFRQLELSSLTPYAARFAGYRIDKGKLDIDLAYRIQDRALTSQNHVVLRQLRLGDKVDSPEAIGIPLKLAVAILRDVDDNIDITLPITGSLDNPEFSIGPILWQTFLNLLTRAVVSPFSALASLAGGDEQSLSGVRFAAGKAALDDGASANLGKLAGAMKSRPALELEIRGVSDAGADRLALQQDKVEAQLALRKLPRLEGLERLLRDQVGRSEVSRLRDLSEVPDPSGRLVLNPAGYEARLMAALAARQSVSDVELRSLAQQRADTIVRQLTAAGIGSERLFVLDAGTASASDGIVTLPLNLTAH